ncbi:CAP domain-containing protein [Sulfitobacter sp. MF3-043]|uniref:CAP domain-containing protein n=1 Tax=Sulfitobacter sediminivivens TaxID=3252902 RepID=UPI0036DADA38
MSVANNLEMQMLQLINSERTTAGLAPLTFADKLNDSSEDHSRWMIDADNFSHTGKGGSSAQDRMADAGYKFEGNWSSGENIAFQSERGEPGLSDDVVDLHNGLMNSPGHRANILNPHFKEIGIGIERGDFTDNGSTFDSVIVTQNFATSDAVNTPTPDPVTPAPVDDLPSNDEVAETPDTDQPTEGETVVTPVEDVVDANNTEEDPDKPDQEDVVGEDDAPKEGDTVAEDDTEMPVEDDTVAEEDGDTPADNEVTDVVDTDDTPSDGDTDDVTDDDDMLAADGCGFDFGDIFTNLDGSEFLISIDADDWVKAEGPDDAEMVSTNVSADDSSDSDAGVCAFDMDTFLQQINDMFDGCSQTQPDITHDEMA